MQAVLSIEVFQNFKPFVAEIIGFHPKYKYDRIFVEHKTDYSGANSKCSRGVKWVYFLEDGLYEAKYQVSWKRIEHKFFEVKNGEIEEICEQKLVERIKDIWG